MPDSGPADPVLPSSGSPPGGTSDAGEDERSAGQAFSELEAAVERLAEAYDELRDRVERSERARRDLADTLAGAGSDDVDPADAERRFRELVEENRRLREVVEEGRERAERIRSRLVMMEDEL